MLSGLSCAYFPVVGNSIKSRKRCYGHPSPRPGAPLLEGVEGTLREGGATAMKFNYDNNLLITFPCPRETRIGLPAREQWSALKDCWSNCSCSGGVFKTVSLNTRGGDSQVGNSCSEHCLSTLEAQASPQVAVQQSLLPKNPDSNNNNRKTFICSIPAAGCSY